MKTDKIENEFRLVVNATPLLGNLTGIGQNIFAISKRLTLTPGFKTDFFTPFRTFSNLESLADGQSKPCVFRLAKALFSRMPFKEAIRKRYMENPRGGVSYDLYWEPNYIPVDSICARRIVTTVCDMSFFEHPEWHPPDRISFFKQNFFKKIGHSDVVTTISEFSKQRFLASQREVGEDRVKVIPCGVDHDVFRVLNAEHVEAFRKKHLLPESFILFVGTVEPRKNLLHLLTAYGNLSASHRETFPLVLAGDKGWENKEILERIHKLGRHVKRFGYIKKQADLALMYNAASVFVYPSLYEGFGIPPLEAMACGTPVCLSSIPVFHEVYGDDAACYADPIDPDALAAALMCILDNSEYRTNLAQRGLILSQKYTWDAAFEKYASVFKQVIAG